ncbi:MAG: hypothetical protein O3A51_09660, partial [Verrucomicrobia bacterium]|nr:hypothetical protein [Verrucomicrobiota bacterium]
MITSIKQSFLWILVAGLLVGARAYAGNTWDGGDGADFWNWNDNWEPNGSPTAGTSMDLTFAGSTRLTPVNNYGDWVSWRAIYFSSGAGSFSITGDSIAFYDDSNLGKIQNDSSALQTFSVNNFSLNGGAYEVNPVSGDITLGGGGSIFNNGNTMEVYGDNSHTLTISKNLQGTGHLNLQQYSIVRIDTTADYSGETQIDEGEFWLDEAGSIPNTTIYVGNGGETANYAKFFLNDANGGTTLSKTINVNGGNGLVDNRTVGALNTSGNNEFSGTIVRSSGGNEAATLFATAGGTVTFSGDVQGDDTIFVKGGGTVSLTADNSSSGEWWIEAGTLAFSDGGAI